jgi:hypothetical protein
MKSAEHASNISKAKTGVKQSSDRIAKAVLTHSKHFSVVSPEGVIYEGINLKAFCVENRLHQGHMAEVNSGIAKTYKGWTSGQF